MTLAISLEGIRIEDETTQVSVQISQILAELTEHSPIIIQISSCFVVIRIQNHEFQTAVYSSLALFEIYKLHIVSVSEK